MRFYVCGATGFVGQTVVRAALEQGHHVTVSVRNQAKASRLFGSDVDYTDAAASPEQMIADLAGTEVVVNLAGEPIAQRWTKTVRARIEESRIDGTRRLVDAMGAAEHGPSVLINASAVGYYGERGDERLPEVAAPGVGFLADVCRRWEEEASRADELGIRVVRLRFGVILGHGGMLAKLALPLSLGFGPRLGRAGDYLPWIHIDDVVALILAAATDDEMRGAYNAVAPEETTWAGFGAALRSSGKVRISVPVPASFIALGLGEASQALLVSQRVTPQRLLDAGFPFAHADLQSALEQHFR